MILSMTLVTALLMALQDGKSQQVQEWIEKLGSEKVEERLAAEEALVERGESILTELQKARASKDAEVVARIDQIVDRVRWWEGRVWVGRRSVDVRTGRAVWELPEPGGRLLSAGRDLIVQ